MLFVVVVAAAAIGVVGVAGGLKPVVVRYVLGCWVVGVVGLLGCWVVGVLGCWWVGIVGTVGIVGQVRM